jgi:hypothetical protein
MYTAEVHMGLSTKETDIVRVCLDWFSLHKILAWRTNNTGIFDPVRKCFRSFHGLKGVSDILGIYPQAARLADGREMVFGSLLACEVKRRGEKPRPDQEWFLNQVREQGGVALCVHSVAELDDQMREYLL